MKYPPPPPPPHGKGQYPMNTQQEIRAIALDLALRVIPYNTGTTSLWEMADDYATYIETGAWPVGLRPEGVNP